MLRRSGLKIFSLLVLLICLVTLSNSTLASSPSQSANVKEAIKFLKELSIIDDFDGLDAPITRGEAAQLLALALELDLSNIKDPQLTDINEDPRYPYIAALYNQNIISGFPDHTFRSDEFITRVQIAKMLTTAFDLQKENTPPLPFIDVNVGNWYYPYVSALYVNKVTTGTSETTFSPKEKVKKSELILFIYRSMNSFEANEGFNAEEDYNNELPSNITYAYEIPVLLYHHLLIDDENIYKHNRMIVSVEQFEEQMELLHNNGFHVATLKELYKFVNGEINLPENTVVITFDDGLKSNFQYAFPILKKYDFTAANYLITNRIRNNAVDFNAELYQYFSWEEVEASREVFEFGGHTHGFHNMNAERRSDFVTKSREEVTLDLLKNIQLLNADFLTFAYPFGQFTEESKEILQELGFKMAFSTIEGYVKPGDDLFELKRIFIYPETTIDDFKLIVGIN